LNKNSSALSMLLYQNQRFRAHKSLFHNLNASQHNKQQLIMQDHMQPCFVITKICASIFLLYHCCVYTFSRFINLNIFSVMLLKQSSFLKTSPVYHILLWTAINATKEMHTALK